MGRWKSDGSGGSYYDPNDSGPDQVKAPTTSTAQVQPTAQQQQGFVAPSQETSKDASPSKVVDYSGWRGAAGDREKFRDSWQATGTDMGAQQNLLSQWGFTPDKSGRVVMPDGEVMDLRFGANAGINRAQWMGGSGGGGGVDPRPGTPESRAAAAGSGGSGSMSMDWRSGGNNGDLRGKLIEQLLKRSGQSLSLNAATDPNIRAQADPYAANIERQRRNYLADTAERLGPGANMQGEARLAQEHAGQASGLFEANLVGQEISARRAEIQDALHSMQGMLTAEQEMSLRKELTQLNDATQRFGIQTSANTASNAQDLAWRQSMMNNDQFNSNLGLQAEDRYNYWDAINRGSLG